MLPPPLTDQFTPMSTAPLTAALNDTVPGRGFITDHHWSEFSPEISRALWTFVATSRSGEPAFENSGIWAPSDLVATIAPRMLGWAS